MKFTFLQEMAAKNGYIGEEAARAKIRQYCAYQERSHAEVKDKLYSFGLGKDQAEEMISELIGENYLNEERFAIAFAGGKFRMKQWGRQKIRYELKQKGVSEYCIKKAIGKIDEEDYEKTFQKLAAEKLRLLKSEKNIFTKKRKLQDYLVGKGYEYDLIGEFLKNL